MLSRSIYTFIIILSLLSGQSLAEGSVPSSGLVDQTGAAFEPVPPDGRHRLLYFGYTNCPDVCPTSLYEMTAALDLLPGASREKVVPVFVTLDPARDTALAMANYVKPLGHGFVTVSGPVEAVDRFAFANRVVGIRNVGEGEFYTVDHTSAVLLIGPDGREIERFPYSMDYREVARRMGDHLAAAPRSTALAVSANKKPTP